MAAIFNGTTSDLSVTVASAAITYPVLVSCWVKPWATTANYTLAAASDDGAGGSLDALVVSARGDQSGDPVWAQSVAAGSASNASATTFTGRVVNPNGTITWPWQHVAALFLSNSHRQVRISQGAYGAEPWSSAETTTRAVGNVTKWSIGSLHNSGASARFEGRLAEVGIWQGIAEDRAYLAADQLRQGLSPHRVWHSRADLFLYQKLRGELNHANFSIGPGMTGTNLTFDPADIPFAETDGDLVSSSFDPEVAPFHWPDYDESPGPLPPQRLVSLDGSERLVLASDSSENWIGCTHHGSISRSRQFVTLRSAGRRIRVEAASGAEFTAGASTAYLASEGKVDDSGTVPVGIVSRVLAGSVEVVPF